MTRSNVRKIAWTLRLIGYSLLMGAATLMFLGTQHASATPGRIASAPFIK